MDENQVIREIAASIYQGKDKEEEPDIKLQEALHHLIPTPQTGRALYNLKKEKGGSNMTYYDDVELEDWERVEFENYDKKQAKWQHEKMQQHIAQRQNQLTQEGFNAAAKDLGMTPEQLGQLLGEPASSQEEQAYYEDHFRNSVKEYWKQRAGMKKGGKPRDSQGRFTSTQQPNRAEIERAKEAKDPDAVLNNLLPDDDPIFRR